MSEVKEYICKDGSSPFAGWFAELNVQAALKVNTYLTRVGNGNLSNVKSVGSGVHECVIDWGPGYRVYYAMAGRSVVLLLCGGDKRTQTSDIARALEHWNDYKRRMGMK